MILKFKPLVKDITKKVTYYTTNNLNYHQKMCVTFLASSVMS